jgi:cytidine deaminase
MISDFDKKVRERLRDLLHKSYAPYSNFRVAAAAVDEGENVHYGVNVENQSFPVATCAEAGAIAALLVAGGKRIKKLYLLSDPNIEAVPCGACRQRIAELGDEDTLIVTFREDGDVSPFLLKELFPHSFRFK